MNLHRIKSAGGIGSRGWLDAAAGGHDRARRIVAECRANRVEAVVVSRIPGASHCPWEGAVIREQVAAHLGLPVVEVEIPPVCDALLPALRTRLQAVMEIARARRKPDSGA